MCIFAHAGLPSSELGSPGANSAVCAAVHLPGDARRRVLATKRVLCGLSEWGYWGEELVGPLVASTTRGTRSTSPRSRQAPARRCRRAWTRTTSTRRSGRSVHRRGGRAEDAGDRRVRRGWTTRSTSRRWLPERPYRSSPNYLRELEAYYKAARRASARSSTTVRRAAASSAAAGPIVDLANNQRVHDLILAFLQPDKPIAAECYGVACLAFARDLGGPQEHHLRQARHRPLHRVRLQGRHRLHRAPTSTWARRRTRWSTSCATRPRPDGALPRQLRQGDLGASSTTRSSPAARRRTRT